MPKGRYERNKHKKPPSIPSIIDICRLLPSENSAIDFLISNGILINPKDTVCPDCKYTGFRVKEKHRLKSLKCNRCNKAMSLMRGTFFANSKVPLHEILYMAVLWLFMTPATTVISQIRVSSATVTDYYNYFRQLIKKFMDQEGHSPIDSLEQTRRLQHHMPKRARKHQLDEHLAVAAWREMHSDTLWESLLEALRKTRFEEGKGGGGVGNEVAKEKKERLLSLEAIKKAEAEEAKKRQELLSQLDPISYLGDYQQQPGAPQVAGPWQHSTPLPPGVDYHQLQQRYEQMQQDVMAGLPPPPDYQQVQQMILQQRFQEQQQQQLRQLNPTDGGAPPQTMPALPPQPIEQGSMQVISTEVAAPSVDDNTNVPPPVTEPQIATAGEPAPAVENTGAEEETIIAPATEGQEAGADPVPEVEEASKKDEEPEKENVQTPQEDQQKVASEAATSTEDAPEEGTEIYV